MFFMDAEHVCVQVMGQVFHGHLIFNIISIALYVVAKQHNGHYQVSLKDT